MKRLTIPTDKFSALPDVFEIDGNQYHLLVWRMTGLPTVAQQSFRFPIGTPKGTEYWVTWVPVKNDSRTKDSEGTPFVQGPFRLGETGPAVMITPKKPTSPFTDPTGGQPGSGRVRKEEPLKDAVAA